MYRLELTVKSHILHVTVHGELNSRTDIAIDADIRRECEALGAESVLIDIRPMSRRLSAVENHIAAKTLRERMGRGVRAVAIVDSDRPDRNSELYELTAINRGATVRFFEECQDAETWLLGFAEPRKAQ